MPRFFFAAVFASLAIGPGDAIAAGAYNSPKFDQPLIEADALSLGKRENDEIVAALTALVSNFSEEAVVDADVKEKALALALNLRPLDSGARAAHRSLAAGLQPARMPLFETLSAVSAALWSHGERLAAPDGEPEDRRLAPMLMELALLVQPEPPAPDRLRAFQKAAEAAPLNWNPVVDLQPAQNPSNAKAISLFRPVSDVEAAPAPAVAPQNPPTGDSSMSSAKPGIIPPDMTSAGEPAATVSEIKIRQTAISYVTVDDDTGEAIGGVAGFQVREPTPDEASLFGLFTDPTLQNSFEMRLTYQRDGATIAGIDLVEKFIRLRHPSWPRRLLGEFSFQPSAGLGTPGQVNLALPGLALLGSAFSGEPLAAAFAPGGEFALAGGLGLNGELGLPPDPSPAEYVRAAAAMSIPPKALFLPAKPGGSIEAGLRDAAIEGAADWILRPQLISYTTIEDLGVVLKDPVPEGLLQAIGDFAAVQGLTDKMTIGEIARNEAVRRRLEQILEKWPAHLSARLLLDLGSRPADAGLSLAGSVKAIDAALQPVIDRYQAQQDGEGVDVAVAKPLTETALRALADLRLKIDMRAKPYLTSVEKTLDAAQTYLSLNNPDSSIGQQRHRELLDRVAEMRLERGRIEPAE